MRALNVRLRALVVTAMLAGVALVPSAAEGAPRGGSSKAQCLAAHEAAQSLLVQKKPHAALEKFVACARVECPTVVRKECVEQVAHVEKDAPTVALEAHDDNGADTTAVKVSMDGAPLADKLTGAAIDVEPGEHVFRFERTDGKSIEQRVLVVEGEKNRKVLADFASLVPKPPVTGPAPPPPQEKKEIPVLAWVAGGVAIAGFASFATFALVGKGEEKDLASSCEPNCKTDQLSPVKRDYLIADISLVVGVLATAGAVILAYPALAGSPHATASAKNARLDPRPAPWLPRVTMRSP